MGMLFPPAGIEPVTSALIAQSLNHRTAREVPIYISPSRDLDESGESPATSPLQSKRFSYIWWYKNTCVLCSRHFFFSEVVNEKPWCCPLAVSLELIQSSGISKSHLHFPCPPSVGKWCVLDHGQGKLVRRVELRPENSVVQAVFAVFKYICILLSFTAFKLLNLFLIGG